jgi:hypothetical protein
LPTIPYVSGQVEAPAPPERRAPVDDLTPADAAALSDTAEIPSDTAEIPSDTAEIPSDTAEIPSDTLEMPADTAVMPRAPVQERPRPSGPWRGLTTRTPVEVLPEVDDEPLGPKVSVPLSVPMESRLRALAILSLLVCAFGVATASVLLVIIVTVSRAVGGI